MRSATLTSLTRVLSRKIQRFRKAVRKKLRRRRPHKEKENKKIDEVTTTVTSPLHSNDSTLSTHDSAQGRSTIVKLSSIDVAVDAGGHEAHHPNTTDSSHKYNAVSGVTSEVETAETYRRKFTRESTKMLLRVSNKSLADSNPMTAEHQINNTDSKKCCTCKNEDVCPCQWEDGNSDMVHLTNLICTPSRIWGRVQVNNVAFEKKIFIRWSQDNWESFCEQPACFEQSATNLRKDAFTFEIERPKESGTIELAVRYCVYDEEYWDNNGGTNYQVLGRY